MSAAVDANQAGQWLETIRGAAPILLIAPHGGRAGPAAAATLHPKVNDLETAAITRELAERLNATALINFGMDRNALDCNRLGQLMTQAPWMIETLRRELAQIIARCQRATVLLIHGWNIIEPRVDLGLGVRERAGRLRAPAGAFVSASDDFIRNQAGELAARLHASGIIPTFGLRYPGGGAQNLLQAFTARQAASEHESLRALAQLAAEGRLNALQLELSVSLRLPSPQRRLALDAIANTFDGANTRIPPLALDIDRAPSPPRRQKSPVARDDAPPLRIGIEFYDPEARLGGMVSFDFGPNAAGGRIMMLFERNRVALFTGEGGAARSGSRIALGPLSFDGGRTGSTLSFKGPAVIVDDSAAYLSVEGALAKGRVDPEMQVEAVLEIGHPSTDFGELLAALESTLARKGESDFWWRNLERALPRYASFGRLSGWTRCDGKFRALNAVARLGISFTALGPQRFAARRMLWACACESNATHALELRELHFDDQPARRVAHFLNGRDWNEAELCRFGLETDSPHHPPQSISATITHDNRSLEMKGAPETFMSLSRPGADGARIHTTLGFGSYLFGGIRTCGMYEYSRRVAQSSGAKGADDD